MLTIFFHARKKARKGTKNKSNVQILSEKVLKNILIVTNVWQFMLYCNQIPQTILPASNSRRLVGN